MVTFALREALAPATHPPPLADRRCSRAQVDYKGQDMSEKIFQVIIIFFSVRASRQARRCSAAATAAAADRHAHRLFTRAPSTIARLLASCGVTPSRTSSTLFTHGRWGCSCPSWCVAFAAAALATAAAPSARVTPPPVPARTLPLAALCQPVSRRSSCRRRHHRRTSQICTPDWPMFNQNPIKWQPCVLAKLAKKKGKAKAN